MIILRFLPNLGGSDFQEGFNRICKPSRLFGDFSLNQRMHIYMKICPFASVLSNLQHAYNELYSATL